MSFYSWLFVAGAIDMLQVICSLCFGCAPPVSWERVSDQALDLYDRWASAQAVASDGEALEIEL